MRRAPVTALLLALAVGGFTPIQAHTHEYDHSGHGVHDHAPAVHSHARAASSSLTIRACDPADHLRTTEFITRLEPQQVRAAVARVEQPVAVAGPEASIRAAAPIDVNAHGPPSVPFRRLRAPPA